MILDQESGAAGVQKLQKDFSEVGVSDREWEISGPILQLLNSCNS